LKVKRLNREEFVVVGWTGPEGARPFLGAPDGPLFFDTVDRFMVCSIYEGLITLEMGAANAGRQSLRGDSIISVELTNSKN
jgi:hypothetical protein